MGLKILLLAAIEKNCRSIYVFKDSILSINWEKGTQRCQTTILFLVVEEIIQLTLHFDLVTISHVYMDRNQTTNRLSKEVVLLQLGQSHIACFLCVDRGGFYHRPFIEGHIFG